MPWYVVTRLGIGLDTDAFFASGALPQLIFLVTSFSLTQVLVPLLATVDEKTLRRDSWAFFLGVSALFGVLAVILFATTGFWVSLLVPGFPPPGRQLTVTLTRIQLLAMIGNAAVVVLWSVYYARQKFIWAELSSLLANAIGLSFLFWTLPIYGIQAAAWATVLTLAIKSGCSCRCWVHGKGRNGILLLSRKRGGASSPSCSVKPMRNQIPWLTGS